MKYLVNGMIIFGLLVGTFCLGIWYGEQMILRKVLDRLYSDSLKIPLTHAQCDSIFKCQKQYRGTK